MLNYLRNKLDQHFDTICDIVTAVACGIALTVGLLAYFDVLTK